MSFIGRTRHVSMNCTIVNSKNDSFVEKIISLPTPICHTTFKPQRKKKKNKNTATPHCRNASIVELTDPRRGPWKNFRHTLPLDFDFFIIK